MFFREKITNTPWGLRASCELHLKCRIANPDQMLYKTIQHALFSIAKTILTKENVCLKKITQFRSFNKKFGLYYKLLYIYIDFN